MRRPWSWCAASLLAAAPAAAATVQEKTIEIEVRPDGTAVERTHLRVLLVDRADLDAWSLVVVPLDENRTLRSIVVSARTPDGAVVPVGKDSGDTHEVAAPGELHGSRKARSVRVPRLPVGSVLNVDHEVVERPYFPGGVVGLQGSAPVERLRVTVRAPAGLRFRVDGAAPGITAGSASGSVEVTGTSVPAVAEVPYAPASQQAVLRYAWGSERDWPAIGAWYQSLLAAVPRGTAAVRQAALEAGAGATDARGRLERALAFVRRRVRYVAVEVGIGGYRPNAPDVALARGWGDCKDKAILLGEILQVLGVESQPALVALAPDDRIDRTFPSPHQFNHVIVAVPAAQLGRTDGLPAAGGFVFVDPTQETGGLEWLAPGTQGQDALVVRAGGSLLVTTPIAPRQEGRRLVASIAVAPDRTATGALRVELGGQAARAVAEALRPLAAADAESRIRRLVASLWPELRVEGGTWSESLAQGVPAATLSVRVTGLDGLTGSLPSLGLPDLAALPSPAALEARTLPVVLSPRRESLSLALDLPGDLCAPPAEDAGVGNAAGRFARRVRVTGRRSLTLEHDAEIAQRWYEPAELPALREVALAAHRAQRRRLRLDCAP
jgi:uncharacterized protein DUF3857